MLFVICFWQCEFALGALTQVLNINNGTNVEVATMTANRGIRMLLDDEVFLSLSLSLSVSPPPDQSFVIANLGGRLLLDDEVSRET